MNSERVKGYIFALVGTLAFSNEYIFSKAALNEIQLAQFGFYWFMISTLLMVAYMGFNKSLSSLLFLSRRQVYILIVLGLLEIVTNTTFYLSIRIIPDPAVTSFLGNMYPVMIILGGVILLGEKFGPAEIVGAFLALAGTFVIGYTGGSSVEKLFIPGTGVVLLNTFFAAVATLVIKVHVKKLSPELINLNRSVWLLGFFIVMVLVFRQSLHIPLTALKNIAIGATLGPFLAILTMYHSLRYIEVSRSSIIQSLKGIFVLIGAYFFFGTFPQTHQIIGGFLTVAGILIMTLAHAGFIKQIRLFPARKK